MKSLKIILTYATILYIAQFLISFIYGLFFEDNILGILVIGVFVVASAWFLGYKATETFMKQKLSLKHFSSPFWVGASVGVVSMLMSAVTNYLFLGDFSGAILPMLAAGFGGKHAGSNSKS